VDHGFSNYWAKVSAAGAAFLFVVILSIAANIIAKRLILQVLTHLIEKTRTKWDDALLERRVLNNLAHLAPAVVIYLMSPIALAEFSLASQVVMSATMIYMVIVIVLAADSFLNAVMDIYHSFEIAKQVPITGSIQIVKLVVYFIGAIFVIATVLGKSPIFLLSGLGALTAVLMLIFKDAILGLVAGIQLTANKMVSVGDWIEMPKYGADGDVIEVALTTVKVQNWDKTVTTVPTYALINESFKNWRGMQDSGGRRIKRAIYIDMNTIKLCTEEMLQKFYNIQYIRAYIEKKKKELQEFNKVQNIVDTSLVNGRRLTNVGTFRAYIEAYLRNHPMIHKNLTFLVRQLAPSDKGLPIEIYVFSTDIAWVNYEAIQADIFDHILAIVPEFELRVFQSPSGSDFAQLNPDKPVTTPN
jgi:miniconductance mechanosensitive channel